MRTTQRQSHPFTRIRWLLAFSTTLLVLVILAFGRPQQIRAEPLPPQAEDGWVLLGQPDGGDVVEIAVDPANPATVFAGTSNGIYRSRNEGDSWSPALNGEIGAEDEILFHPVNSNFIYVDREYASQNGGDSWQSIDPNFRIDLANPGVLYTSNSCDGIQKSTDNGRTWFSIENGLPQICPNYASLLPVDSTDGKTVYASVPISKDETSTLEYALFRSNDGGSNWIFASNIFTQPIYSAAVDPSDPTTIFVHYEGSWFRSVDSGQTWFLLPQALGTLYPQGSGIVYSQVSGDILRSSDEGNTWQSIWASVGYTETGRIAKLDPGKPNTLFVLSSGNLYVTENAGSQWSRIFDRSSFSVAWPSSFDFSHSGTATFYLGVVAQGFIRANAPDTQTCVCSEWSLTHGKSAIRSVGQPLSNPRVNDYSIINGVLSSRDNGLTWQDSNLGLKAQNFIKVNSHPDVPGLYFALTEIGLLLESHNKGQTWQRSTFPGLPTFFAKHGSTPAIYVMNSFRYSGLYFGLSGKSGQIYRSIDGGHTWNNLADNLPRNAQGYAYVTDMAIHPENTQLLYATANDSIYKSMDGGLRWITASVGIDTPATFLSIAPSAPDTLYAVAGGRSSARQVYRTTNGGSTWSPMAELPAAVTWTDSFVVDPVDAQTVYAGTTWKGLYKSTDGAESWFQPTQQFSTSMILQLVINPLDSTELYALIKGDGIYRSRDAGVTWSLFSANVSGGRIRGMRLSPNLTGNYDLLAVTSHSGVWRYPNAVRRPQTSVQLVALTDLNALRQEFLDTGYTIGQDQDTNGVDDWGDFFVRFNRYLDEHAGILLDLADEITVKNGYLVNYVELDYGVHADRVQMGELIDELLYRKSAVEKLPLENVVILGSDQVVPFYRIPDPTDKQLAQGNVGIVTDGHSKERAYPGEVGGAQGNVALEDSGLGFILSDLPYASKERHTTALDSSLRPNLGLGRVFAATPDELRRAVDAFEQPIVLARESAQASVFAHKDIQRGIDFPAAIRRSLWPVVDQWFGSQQSRLLSGTRPDTWDTTAVIDAFNGDALVSIWSHANHRQIQVVSDAAAATSSQNLAAPRQSAAAFSLFLPLIESKVAGADYIDSLKSHHLAQLGVGESGRVFLGLGCNLGYSVANYPDGQPSEHYTLALVNQFIAKGITTLAPTSYASLQVNHASPNLNELMTTLFARHLLHNEQVETVGDIWQYAFPDYRITDPYGLSDNIYNNGYHRKAAYGNALYGLPTQRIVRRQAGIQGLRLSESTAVPAQQRMASANTISVAIDVPEFIVEQLTDGSLFRIPNGGTQIAPDFGPALPVVMRTFILPHNAENIQVSQLSGGKATFFPGAVNLPKTALFTTNGEAIAGDFQIPSTYPEQIFWYSVSPQNYGQRVDLMIIPMEYSPSQRQVTVYTHLDFQVDYLLTASTGPFFSAVQVAAPEVQRGTPLAVDLTVAAPERRQLMLWWRAQGADGIPIAVKQNPLTVVGQMDISFQIDTSDWPAGKFDLTFGLSDGDGILDTENVSLNLVGTRLQWSSDVPQWIAAGQAQTSLRIYLYDQDGKPLAGLANQLSVTVNEAVVSPVVEEIRAGAYEIRLATGQWTPGSYTISLSAGDNSQPIVTTIDVVVGSRSMDLSDVGSR